MERYWNDIPIGRENAISYTQLSLKWQTSRRNVRNILHDLSGEDFGDGLVLIRSSKSKGFYRTDYLPDIRQYRQECINRAKNTLAPLPQINRILKQSEMRLKSLSCEDKESAC